MKKKGFTLIELLAVIIVLSIISLIGVTIILNVVERVRKEAFKESVYGALEAAEYYYYKNPETIQVSVTDLELKSNSLKEGIINLNGKILEAVNITDGRYCGNTVENEVVVTKGNCGYETGEGSITLVSKEIGLNYLTVEVVYADFEEEYYTYEYKLKNSEGITIKNWVETRENTYTFSGLKQDTEYTVEAKIKTEKLMDAVIKESTEKYAKSKVISIEYPTYEGYSFEYSYSIDGVNYIEVEETKIEIEINKNTTIYARVNDGYNNYETKYEETKIDNEEPIIGEMEDIEIIEGKSYDLSDIEVSENSNKYTVTKSINDTSVLKHGEYTIAYQVEDEVGNIAMRTRKLTVKMKKDTSGANSPSISGDLVPVVYDYGKEGFVKADTSSNWYNYEGKEWANAVILIDSCKCQYKVGEIIQESDIESYFVWIPRYKYKLWNTGTASKTVHTIEIEFEDKSVTASTGSNNGEWLTHLAFTSFDTNGFWVGKFETGYNGATSTFGAQVNSSDTSKVIIKPNVYSWRDITVGNIFTVSYNYERGLDSHMMKNTEWGAVAYLSHSKYGINAEVNMNNNSSYITGYSSVVVQTSFPGTYGTDVSVTLPYNTTTGVKASTTGNITGIYDMSGGAWEYVAGYISGNVGSSGLKPSNYDSKYFDVYSSSSTRTSYQYRILGDATGEMGPFNYNITIGYYATAWYKEFSEFVESSKPWFGRWGWPPGGYINGIFGFSSDTGGVRNDGGGGFRLVLTP